MFLIIFVTSTLVGAFFFITFWAYRKHQLERLEQEVIEKQDEILMAVTSFRSLLNLESYISKGEYEVTIEGRRSSKGETACMQNEKDACVLSPIHTQNA